MPFPGSMLLPVWDMYTLKDRVRQLTQFNFTMKPPCVHTKQWYNYDVISTNNRIPYFNGYKWTNRKSVLRLVGSQLSVMLLPHLGWFAPVTNGCQTLSTHSTFALYALCCCSVALTVCSDFTCHSLVEPSTHWTDINYFSSFRWNLTFPQLLRQLEQKFAPGDVAAGFHFVDDLCIYSSQIQNVEKDSQWPCPAGCLGALLISLRMLSSTSMPHLLRL